MSSSTPRGIRTPDPSLVRRTLSTLSYRCKICECLQLSSQFKVSSRHHEWLTGRTTRNVGIEPTSRGLESLMLPLHQFPKRSVPRQCPVRPKLTACRNGLRRRRPCTCKLSIHHPLTNRTSQHPESNRILRITSAARHHLRLVGTNPYPKR